MGTPRLGDDDMIFIPPFLKDNDEREVLQRRIGVVSCPMDWRHFLKILRILRMKIGRTMEQSADEKVRIRMFLSSNTKMTVFGVVRSLKHPKSLECALEQFDEFRMKLA